MGASCRGSRVCSAGVRYYGTGRPLDAAKKGIRDAEVVLPRRIPLLEKFAEHLASDAKQLIEDEETGAKSYRYVRTGVNHYSLASPTTGSPRSRSEGPAGTASSPSLTMTMTCRTGRTSSARCGTKGLSGRFDGIDTGPSKGVPLGFGD